MATYQIWNRTSGILFGTYEGNTERQAIDAMARDAGYKSAEDAARVLEATVEAYIADLRVVES